MPLAGPTPRISFAAALSGHAQSVSAADQACERILAALDENPRRAAPGLPRLAPVDAAFLFISAQHAPAAQAIASIVRKRLGPRALIGLTAESIIANDTELENAAGVSILAASLPGVRIHPFRLEDLRA